MSEHPQRTDREAKAQRCTASKSVFEASDPVVVPVNPSNKDGPPSAWALPHLCGVFVTDALIYH
jgi:hypothetical protein